MKNILVGVLLIFVMVTMRRAALIEARCDDNCAVIPCVTPWDAAYDEETDTYSWYTGPDGWCVSPYGPYDPKLTYIQELWAIACSGCSE